MALGKWLSQSTDRLASKRTWIGFPEPTEKSQTWWCPLVIPARDGGQGRTLGLAGPNVKLQVNEGTGSKWIAFPGTESR